MSDIGKIIDGVSKMWVEKYRPKELKDLVVSSEARLQLEKMRTDDSWPHILFCGIQGCGKTTTAKIIGNDIVGGDVLYINASDESGVDTIRDKVKRFVEVGSFVDALKIVILDEADGLTPTAQRLLRNLMEEYQEHCRFILTANRKSSIIQPLQSRCQDIDLNPPVLDVLKRILYILKEEDIKYDKDQLSKISNLIKSRYPDIRKIINIIQQCAHNGHLDLTYNGIEQEFIEELYALVKADKTDPKIIRQFIADNDLKYHRDYHSLMKTLLEYITQQKETYEFKANAVYVLTEHMYRHTSVMDPEINAFAALIKI